MAGTVHVQYMSKTSKQKYCTVMVTVGYMYFKGTKQYPIGASYM
jgi:outer membrane protease